LEKFKKRREEAPIMNYYKSTAVTSEKEFDQLLQNGNFVSIATLPWGGSYRPGSRGIVSPDYVTGGIWVGLSTIEPYQNIRATVNEFDGRVWEDSCLEFFVNPMPEKGLSYLNFENNSLSAMLCGVHNGEIDGQPEGYCAADFRMRLTRVPVDEKRLFWSVRFFIPFSYIKRWFPDFNPVPGMKITGNFYKCGDLCPIPHYLSWSPVVWPSPSFHRPECFGEIIL
jgi:hypothetical protein